MGWATRQRARPASPSVKVEGSRAAVELGKQAALDLDLLRRVLLDMGRTRQRLSEIARRGDAPADLAWALSLQQVVTGEIGQHRIDEGERLVEGGWLAVDHRHVVTGAREADRPGSPDQSSADDRNLSHDPVL